MEKKTNVKQKTKISTVEERQKSKKSEFLEEYNRTGGILVSCKNLHVSPNTVRKWRKTDEKFDRKCAEVEEYFLNRVECRAYDIALNKGDVNMIKFLLLTRMRDKYAYDNKLQGNEKKTIVLNVSKDEEQY